MQICVYVLSEFSKHESVCVNTFSPFPIQNQQQRLPESPPFHVNYGTAVVCPFYFKPHPLCLHLCLRELISPPLWQHFPDGRSLCGCSEHTAGDENAGKYLINTIESRYLIRLRLHARLWTTWRMGTVMKTPLPDLEVFLQDWARVSIRLKAPALWKNRIFSAWRLVWASDLRLTCKLSLFCASAPIAPPQTHPESAFLRSVPWSLLLRANKPSLRTPALWNLSLSPCLHLGSAWQHYFRGHELMLGTPEAKSGSGEEYAKGIVLRMNAPDF